MPEAYAVQESSGRSRAAATPAYDRRIAVFSPEGRLYQVEYVFNAVKLARVTSVAVRWDDSVCVITQRKATDKLLDTTSCSHMFPITQRLGLVAIGMPANGWALAYEVRDEAAEFHLMWGYEMPPHVLAQWIAARAQICTQHAYTRPYGIGHLYYLTCVLAYWGVVKPAIILFFLYVLKDLIVAMILGIDEEKGTPQHFTCDPAGQVFGHKMALSAMRHALKEDFGVHELEMGVKLLFQMGAVRKKDPIFKMQTKVVLARRQS